MTLNKKEASNNREKATINKEFIEQLNYIIEIINKWNSTNDSQLIISNLKKIHYLINGFCDYFLDKQKHNQNLNKGEVLLLQNIETVILSLIPSYQLLLMGSANSFSNMELFIISRVLYSENHGETLASKCAKIFLKNSQYHISPRLPDILLYFVPVSVFFNQIENKHISPKKHEIYKKIDFYIGQIEEELNTGKDYYLPYIFNIALMTSHCSQIKLLDFIKYSKKIHLLKKFKPKNKDYLYRLFENIFIDKFVDREPLNQMKTFFHYTQLEYLDQILSTQSLKFSNLINLNDADEGSLFHNNNKIKGNTFSFSSTFNGDSFALFNSYTNLEGISIEFDYGYFFQSLQYLKSLAGKNHEYMSYIRIESLPINYFPSKKEAKKYIKDWEEMIKNSFKDIVSSEYINSSINKSKDFIEIMSKTAPWKYEQEMRIAFVLKSNIDKIKMLNGKYQDGSLFIKIPTNDKLLIKRIIIGPKIKNSKFKREILSNILKKYKLDHIPVEETEINLK